MSNSKLCCRSCYPTLASDNTFPHTRELLRAQLCEAYHNNTNFDLGMLLNVSPCNTEPGQVHPTCRGCQPCHNATALTPQQQARYKYQLIVDGQAATNDASVWKLLSNSAVIRLRPDRWSTPLWEQFYDPLLVPYKHIIPSDIQGLPHAVQWCEDHAQECEQMGAASRALMKCLLRPEVLEEYIFSAFRYVHNSVHKLWQA